MRLFIGFAVLALAGCTIDEDPKVQLEAMYESDQAYRVEIQELAVAQETRSVRFLTLWARQEWNDWANLKRLERLVQSSGWPRQCEVGTKGATAAFLVIQHAGLERQKEYLPLLQAAVKEGEARATDLALLEDRILMREGKPQRYGSQLQSNGKGGWELYPIENEERVDERRKAVGLPPLAEYAKEFGLAYVPAGAQQGVPADGSRPAGEPRR